MLARNEGVLIGPDVKDIKSCVKIIDNMIRKVERIGKIISELQAPPAGEPADPEAGVGS